MITSIENTFNDTFTVLSPLHEAYLNLCGDVFPERNYNDGSHKTNQTILFICLSKALDLVFT